MAQDQIDILLDSLFKKSEEIAERCSLLKDSSSLEDDNGPKWFVACGLLIVAASILAQTELKTNSKDSDSVPSTEWAPMKADATGTGQKNSTTTDVTAPSQNSTISVHSSIPRSILIALILQAIQMILILYMGTNAAKTIDLIGNQFYPTAIILLAFAEFMILLSLGAVHEALSRAQVDLKLSGECLKMHKIFAFSVGLATFVLLWPWYSLLSASPKH